MKRLKVKQHCIDDLSKESFMTIFLFLDGPSLYNIMLTCKYFECVINNSAFWKLCLQENKTWKQICKQYMSSSEKWLNLNARSKIGLANQISKSPILKFLNGMCTKVADMGYWGICFRCSAIISYNPITIVGEFEVLCWGKPKENNLRFFDFYCDNNNSQYFNARDVYYQLSIFWKNNKSDFNEIIKYLEYLKTYIIFRRVTYMDDTTIIEMRISWEKKNEIQKSSSCMIL